MMPGMPGVPGGAQAGQMPQMPMFPMMQQMPQQTPTPGGDQSQMSPEAMTQYNQQIIMMQQQALAQYH